MNTYIPEGYKSLLGVYDTQKAIGLLKRLFEDQLAANLNLFRVSAPLFLEESSGLNDNLNGYERPVSFDILQTGKEAQVVQSLAKWKRMALYRYDFYPGKGLYTDMNAIRRDEDVLDNLHSVYVDQWDWEKVIERRDRNVAYLEQTVRAIVGAVVETNDALQIAFPSLHTKLDREVFFVTTQELEDRWPDYTPKQREDAICKEQKRVQREKQKEFKASHPELFGRYPKFSKALAKVLDPSDEIKPATMEEQIGNQESVMDFTLPAQVREFFLLTAGINVFTGVIVELSGTFNLTIHGERYCVLGEFWKEADGDQLLLRPGEETIWYYTHEQDKVKRLCSDMAELLEKKLARYLNEK